MSSVIIKYLQGSNNFFDPRAMSAGCRLRSRAGTVFVAGHLLAQVNFTDRYSYSDR